MEDLCLTVYGFVGHSGTGKSHHALEIAMRMGVTHILDDGLLIRENQVLAGASAKREASRIASIRRALYTNEEHAKAVREALNDSGAQSAMILGTSTQMVDQIAKRLLLPPISTYIDITEVLPQSDIDAARAVRINEGKHVIPAPTFALKKEFSGYFLAPLRRLVKRGKKSAAVMPAGSNNAAKSLKRPGKVKDYGERTVVRPTYSYLGGYSISRAALEQLVCCIAIKSEGVAGVLDANVDFTDDGLNIEMSLCIKYGAYIRKVLGEAVKLLRIEVDRQTSLHIRKVKLIAKLLDFGKDTVESIG